MTLTDAMRRVLVDLSDGSWSDDAGPARGRYSAQTLARLDYSGLIRPDVDHGPFADRNWTITQSGLDALEAGQ